MQLNLTLVLASLHKLILTEGELNLYGIRGDVGRNLRETGENLVVFWSHQILKDGVLQGDEPVIGDGLALGQLDLDLFNFLRRKVGLRIGQVISGNLAATHDTVGLI